MRLFLFKIKKKWKINKEWWLMSRRLLNMYVTDIQRKEFSALTCFDFPLFSIPSLSLSLSQVSSYNLPKSKTQVPFSWINPYIFFNQSKTHYPNHKWEFGAEDNKEVNEELEHMEGSDRDRVLTLLFFFFFLFSLTCGTISLSCYLLCFRVGKFHDNIYLYKKQLKKI